MSCLGTELFEAVISVSEAETAEPKYPDAEGWSKE